MNRLGSPKTEPTGALELEPESMKDPLPPQKSAVLISHKKWMEDSCSGASSDAPGVRPNPLTAPGVLLVLDYLTRKHLPEENGTWKCREPLGF
ncbi:hypothetical protein NDU88_001983 [Pleurodeles waltl]|uniref:Uncharacterized protein n=1 Tax=Pleurodeles waltl TaxID=8319 RepID=A0AAV7SBM1_PLEWA|nr:hypothetical protein NDU88_001983 [Pleurodeles waltl]